ncbi:MAG: TOBE domain-containing protein, partial [Rhodospirillaceae bacterium]|nr:TOBE domain-containing protein [Rhodospirillaceae bacterium]
AAGATAQVGIRPEHIRISAQPPEDAVNIVSGRIETTVYKGAHVEVYVGTAAGIEFLARQPAVSTEGGGLRSGDPVYLSFEPGNVLLFPSES